MLKIKIVAVGKLKEKYLVEAVAEYSKRISRFANISVVEVDECSVYKTPTEKDICNILKNESINIKRHLEGAVVVLDIDGKQLTSQQIAEYVCNIQQTHSTITFVIGGSFGLLEELKKDSQLRLSFGKITLPHQLARVVTLEQIYRSLTIINNVSYHK